MQRHGIPRQRQALRGAHGIDPLHPRPQLSYGPHRCLRILAQRANIEHRHDAIAHELENIAAMGLDDLHHMSEIIVQEIDQILAGQTFGQFGKPTQIK